MIIYEEGKITAISKSLLNTLNTNLGELSEIINQIELETAVLNKTSINIKNQSFKITKEDLITLKNLSVFTLKQEEVLPELPKEEPAENIQPLQMPTIEQSEEKPQETLSNILPEEPKQEENLNPLNLATQEEVLPELPKEESAENIQPLQMQTIEQSEEKPQETLSNILPEESKQEENLNPLNLATQEEILPELPKEENLNNEEDNAPIELDFEENITECEKILAQKDIKSLINKELETAKEELGIDDEMTQELFNDLLEQFKDKKEAFYKALEKQDYEQLHEIAHFLKGASLNLRLSNISFIFKTIDEESKKHTNLNTIKKLIDGFYDFINRFENGNEEENEINTSEINNESQHIEIDPKIKNIVLNTIKQYLETQDEQKFQKDKAFLERLLNREISSLKDLEYLWKDEQ